MKMLEKIDWKVLDTYIKKDLIIANKHPEYDIWILNYSKTTQFTKAWDLYTLNCRGLIIDINGNIVSRCLPKFFNYEEHNPSEINMSQEFEVYEKMDGSYISLFIYNNEWIFSSRGSFTSDQAVLAKKVFNLKYLNNVLLHNDRNYIMELIGCNNIIVIHYPENDLILLTSIITKTGEESNIYDKSFNGFNRLKNM